MSPRPKSAGLSAVWQEMDNRHFVKFYVRAGRTLARSVRGLEWEILTKLALYVRPSDNHTRLAQEDIAILTGKHPRHVRRALKALLERGLIIEHKQGRTKTYEVNPEFAFRGRGNSKR